MLKFSLVEMDKSPTIRFEYYKETEIILILKEENITKVNVINNSYYYEFVSKTNIYIIGITVHMWEKHNFENLFTCDDVLNIQYSIRKVFGYRERAFSVGSNNYYPPPRITNRPHETPNHGPGKSNFDMYYHRKTYSFPENWPIHEESWKMQVNK